ncbi:MAG: endonuclease dU, partial [Promethearchaeota archaeon]
MKDNPITIGFDDSKFELKSSNKKTQLIGVVCQGTRMVNAVKKEILIDGDDATEALVELVKLNLNHIQYILTDTITFGG